MAPAQRLAQDCAQPLACWRYKTLEECKAMRTTNAAAQRAVVHATKCSIRRACFAALNRLFLMPSLITPNSVIWDSPQNI